MPKPQPISRAVAIHAFAAQEKGDLSFREGAKIAVTSYGGDPGKDWWTGYVESDAAATVGSFPKKWVLEYLQEPERVQATHDFLNDIRHDLDGDNNPDISFRTGDVLLVEAKAEGEWWYGRVEGQDSEVGFFPAKYVAPMVEAVVPTGPPKAVQIDVSIPGSRIDCRLTQARSGGFGLELMQLKGVTVIGYHKQPGGELPTAAAQVPVGSVILGVNGQLVSTIADCKKVLKQSGQSWADFSFHLAEHVKQAHDSLQFPGKEAILSGTQSDGPPLWGHPAALDLFASPFVPKPVRKLNEKQGLSMLQGSLQLVTGALEQLAAEGNHQSRAVQHARDAFARSALLLTSFSENLFGTADAVRFHRFLQDLVSELLRMDRGSSRVFPGGWCLPPKSEGSPPVHVALLFIIHLHHDDTYSLAVCNSGKGSQYHVCQPAEASGELEKTLSYSLYDIPKHRVIDSSVWFLIFRQMAYPDKNNGPAALYEQLLPYLNQRPLLSNMQGFVGSNWKPLPISSDRDTSRIGIVLEGLQQTLIFGGLTPHYAQHVSTLVSWTLAQKLEAGLRNVPFLPTSEANVVKFMGQGLAKLAARESESPHSPITVSECQQIAQCVSAILSGAEKFLPSDLPEAVPEGLSEPLSPSVCDCPLFGPLRRDASVENLIGDAPNPAISIPVCFTQMADSVSTHLDAATAMRDCVEICTLLDYQKDSIKNSYLHRAALVQHLFIRVIPMPLPQNADQSECFWASCQMRYADQADILRLLDMLCRQYVAVSLSLNVTRSFDAIRMLVLGIMACIADRVLRIPACDRPSKFGQHYSGNMPGPVKPFGFDMGIYAIESESAKFTDPDLATARTQLLDYFHQQRSGLDDDHMIFAFERGMALGTGDCALLNQLALSTGYSRESLGKPELLRILTGEDREILDLDPSIGFFRNIVFYFKSFFVPSSDQLPAMAHWRGIDAALEWKTADLEMKVFGFGQQLKCSGFMKAGEERRGFLSTLFGDGKPRAPPSGANPSNLANEEIKGEDDVLFIKHLPDFGGRLPSRSCELLLQYLTAPYLRIPLVLQFFADQMRVMSLGSEELQDVLDACLFEPGLWQAKHEKSVPESVPSNDPSLLATSAGLLFNELIHSPGHVVDAIDRMAQYVLELDEGKFGENSSSYILYVTRLMVRLQSYILSVLQHRQWIASDTRVGGPGGASHVRGLDIEDAELEVLRAANEMLTSRLTNSMCPLIEGWCKRCVREKAINTASVLFAHLAYIQKNATIDKSTAGMMLTAQMFLHNNYTFDADEIGTAPKSRGSSKNRSQEQEVKRSLGIEQTEIFQIFQQHRGSVLTWLRANPAEASEVMEGVIRVLTFTGWMTRDADTSHEPRGWHTSEEGGKVGRFQPDTEIASAAALAEADAIANYEDWLRFVTTVSVETEINVQLGEFTLQKQHMQLLPSSTFDDVDFIQVFGADAKNFGIQCAGVKKTSKRSWLRLVGRRHDIQLWVPDDRTPTNPCGRLLGRYPRGLKSSEEWIRAVLDPVVKDYADTMHLSIQAEECVGNVAKLAGHFHSSGPQEEGDTTFEPLREVYVVRDPPVVQVFDVVEHGRRWYRELVYCSSDGMSLHDMQISAKQFDGVEPRFVGGDLSGRRRASRSLVITRNLSVASGLETFIPTRFLTGILPDGLIDGYIFWQRNTDDAILGYQKPGFRAAAKFPSVIEATLHASGDADASGFCMSLANARVVRRFEDTEGTEHTLVNLMYAEPGTVLAALRAICCRIDNLSNVLAWSTASADGSSAVVDLLEFPRLRLSFTVADGKLWSNDQSGYFVSNFRSDEINSLLGGIPNSILLEDTSRQRSILVPANAKPARPNDPRAPWATAVMLTRSDEDWLGNLSDVRHYMYPVHLSGTFVITTTLPSALYMLVLKWLSRKYEKAYAMIDSCLSDTQLSAEESQIFSLLSSVADDMHPDAVACRVKLLLATAASADTMPVSWILSDTMAYYSDVREHVAAACRLSVEEELELLEKCPATSRTLKMKNRMSFLQAIHKTPSHPVARIEYPEVPRGHLHFDRLFDTTALQGPEFLSTLSTLASTLAYKRPIEKPKPTKKNPNPVEEQIIGPAAIECLNKWVSQQLRLSAGTGIGSGLGFLFFYELYTGTLAFKILDSDSTQQLSSSLLRTVPEEDSKRGSMLMSILRILDAHPVLSAAPAIPKYEPEEKSFSSMFKGGKEHISTFLSSVHEFLTNQQVTQIVAPPPPGAEKDWLMVGTQGSDHPGNAISRRTFTYPALAVLQEMDRSWVTLRVQNYGCNEREMRPVQHQSSGGDCSVAADDVAAYATAPLTQLTGSLERYIAKRTRSDRGLHAISSRFTDAADVEKHPSSTSHVAEEMIERLTVDVKYFADRENSIGVPRLKTMFDPDVVAMVANPAGHQVSDAISLCQQLLDALRQLKERDVQHAHVAIAEVVKLANSEYHIWSEHCQKDDAVLLLRRLSNHEPVLDYEMLVAMLLCDSGDEDMRKLNPSLLPEDIKHIQALTVGTMLSVNRLAMLMRCEDMAAGLLKALVQLQSMTPAKAGADTAIFSGLQLKAGTLAGMLATERQIVTRSDDGRYTFDPRFLVFEFTYNMVLRGQQYQLIRKFVDAARNGKSLCHQMIMGAGKTTVVGPLLALLLGDGRTLITQIVPGALLEMSRSVMREKFSAVIHKSVFTFNFDRKTPVTTELQQKLQKARDSSAVVCSTPTSVKSFVIKLVEMLHLLDHSMIERSESSTGAFNFRGLFGLSRSKPRTYSQEELDGMRNQIRIANHILGLFQSGALLLDEVDLILHPLKSELNWPLGDKEPLDLTMNRSQPGLRWQIPFVLMDAIMYVQEGRMTVELADNQHAVVALSNIKATIEEGAADKLVMMEPHIVLLSADFYTKQLMPLLADWLLCWLKQQRLKELTVSQAAEYLVKGAGSDAAAVVKRECSDEDVKVLNISHDWLTSFMPFLLGKIDRVSFGLLRPDDLARAMKTSPKMPRSRKMLAVPFVGKDVPSTASEFSHPDVVIGLTTLAYRYEGLRDSDFRRIMIELHQDLQSEVGNYNARQSWHTFARWVALSGGRVKGVSKKLQAEYVKGYSSSATLLGDDERPGMTEYEHTLRNVWPLQLIDLRDKEQFDFLFGLLSKSAQMIQHYLFNTIFPETMEFQPTRLTSNGQDLGGDLVFGQRFGFSGTPSNLVRYSVRPVAPALPPASASRI